MATHFKSDFLKNFYDIQFETKILILTALLSTFLLYYFAKRNRKLPPGPTGLPIFGYLPFLGSEPYKKVASLAKKYGNVFGLYLGQKYVVFLNDWDSVKEGFSKSETANRPPGVFDDMPDGFGFTDMNGADWSEQRKFTMKTMKDIGLGRTRWEEQVQEEVDDLLKTLQKENGKEIDVNHYLAPTFANNIMTLVLGYRLPFGHPDSQLVSRSVDSVMRSFPVIGMQNFLPRLHTLLQKIGSHHSELVKGILDFSKYARNVIKETLSKNEEQSKDSFIIRYQNEVENRTKSNTSTNFISKHLIGNTQGLLVGGSETSRTGTIWLLLALAKHQEIQRKVREELNDVIGVDGKVCWADRMKLPYTYAVIMETMRWKTIVPLNALRMTVHDIQIGGYDIPKGTTIIGNYWALHRDPKYWPEPDKFVPERFLLNEGKQVNFKPDGYAPFSYGRRSCPGELIALMEVLLYFTSLVRKFEILPPEDGSLNYETYLGLTYQSRNLRLRFVPRK